MMGLLYTFQKSCQLFKLLLFNNLFFIQVKAWRDFNEMMNIDRNGFHQKKKAHKNIKIQRSY